MAYYEMSFANHNILDIALSLIPPTVVQIRKNQGTEVNKYGQTESAYSEWIEVYGIVQPGGEQNEHTNGVDFSKKHVTIWLRGISLDGTHIQWVPDQIRYVGCIYNVVGVKDWYPYDNYKECDCVEAMNLGENQRGRLPNLLEARKAASRRKVRVNENQQMLSFETPQGENEKPTSRPCRKPVIFTADKPTESTKINVEETMPKEEPIEVSKEKSQIGKKRIKF